MRGAHQHGEKAAARAADEHRRADRARDHDADDVGKLDREIVVLGVGVVFGSAAPARIDGDDAPLPAAMRQCRSEVIEIGDGAGKARQADDWRAGCAARAVFAHVQSQPILHRHEMTRARIGRALSRRCRRVRCGQHGGHG